MNRKLLVICGLTATGKTRLGMNLAKKFGGELVSADSRQVYRGMDIGTGKDRHKNLEFRISNLEFADREIGYYTDNYIRLWGYDLVNPKEDFSVSVYYEISAKIINNIWKRKKLPIIVGGTGLYIKSLTNGIDSISVKPIPSLRKKLSNKSVQELIFELRKIDPEKVDAMNVSDKNNPRRLVRAIEIAKQASDIKYQTSRPNNKIENNSLLKIGLKADKDYLNDRIERRVEDRMAQGFEDEVLSLLGRKVDWKYKAMQGMGYRQYEDYYLGNITKDEYIRNWKEEEQKYAKRQMTWFKKDPKIVWFDISNPDWGSDVEKVVGNWYYDIRSDR